MIEREKVKELEQSFPLIHQIEKNFHQIQFQHQNTEFFHFSQCKNSFIEKKNRNEFNFFILFFTFYLLLASSLSNLGNLQIFSSYLPHVYLLLVQ